jgi:hypothetical protein
MKRFYYHYTFARHLQNIQEQGIKPFIEGEGNFEPYNLHPLMRFQPDDGVVWLTTCKMAPEFFGGFEGALMRVTVSLSPNNRKLHYWPAWLKKNEPGFLAGLVTGDLEEDGWREHWIFEGTILPSKIVAIDFDPLIEEHYPAEAS